MPSRALTLLGTQRYIYTDTWTLNHSHPYIQSTPVLCDTNWQAKQEHLIISTLVLTVYTSSRHCVCAHVQLDHSYVLLTFHLWLKVLALHNVGHRMTSVQRALSTLSPVLPPERRTEGQREGGTERERGWREGGRRERGWREGGGRRGGEGREGREGKDRNLLHLPPLPYKVYSPCIPPSPYSEIQLNYSGTLQKC